MLDAINADSDTPAGAHIDTYVIVTEIGVPPVHGNSATSSRFVIRARYQGDPIRAIGLLRYAEDSIINGDDG